MPHATAALCIGGMVVARTVVNPAVAEELREACTFVALGLGGWTKHRKAKNRKSS
jgi:TetR/AcrR family transcriptional regulator, transcriptional repressor for nem operon